MADNLHFDLVSPEELLLSENVEMVTVPGREGDFGVLAGHAPVMTTLRPGYLALKSEKGERKIFVRGGFAEVSASGLTVLAEEAIPADELNAAEVDQDIQNAEEDLRDAKDDDSRQRAQETLDHLKQIRNGL